MWKSEQSTYNKKNRIYASFYSLFSHFIFCFSDSSAILPGAETASFLNFKCFASSRSLVHDLHEFDFVFDLVHGNWDECRACVR